VKNNLAKILEDEVFKNIDLERATGLSATTISNVVNEKANPNKHTKGRIVKGLKKLIGSSKYGRKDVFPEG
jgi:hypothetical protein